MRIKQMATLAIFAAWIAPWCAGQAQRAPDRAPDLQHMTDAEVEAWVRDKLDSGLPFGDGLVSPTVFKSAVTVPLIEAKIEEVLRSNNPASCFSTPNVDPKIFVRDAAHLIEGAGDETALKAASQLMRIDEARFSGIVSMTLYSVPGNRNRFTVAYRGFAIGDPAVDRRIGEWAETILAQEDGQSTKKAWAEAMLEKYGVVPNTEQWATDPIATRLSQKTLELVRESVTRLAVEALEKRTRK
jgi:hypothetical protein